MRPPEPLASREPPMAVPRLSIVVSSLALVVLLLPTAAAQDGKPGKDGQPGKPGEPGQPGQDAGAEKDKGPDEKDLVHEYDKAVKAKDPAARAAAVTALGD